VKLVGGVTWLPELLDHNTEEWQDLASNVQRQVGIGSSGAVGIADCCMLSHGWKVNECIGKDGTCMEGLSKISDYLVSALGEGKLLFV
jgi:hypothetical protein